MSWSRRPSVFWGGLLVGLGVLFLLANLGALDNVNWDLVWPVLLIGLGVWLMGARFWRGAGTSSLDTSEPGAGLTSARLDVAVGSAQMDVRTADLGDQLYRVRVERASSMPDVRFERETSTLRISQRDAWFPWRWTSRIEVTLSPTVEWAIACQTGAVRGVFDLAAARVSGFDCRTGASRIELNLPRPHAIVPLRVQGGAAHVDVSRPAGAAISVRATGAAVHLTTDGARQDGLGSREWRSSAYDAATDRFELVVEGAAADVTVRERPA